MTETSSPITPQQIIDHLWAARSAMALAAGIEHEVFTHVANGERTAVDIAKAAKASKRGMEPLLDALVALQYLTKKGNQYGLAPVSEMFLVKSKPTYMGAFAQETALNWEAWGKLAEVVKTGKPVVAVDAEKFGKEFFPKLVAAIFPMSYSGASFVAQSLTAKQRSKITAILDVAAGSAAWSLPFAQAIPAAQITVVDYPEVTPIARQFVEKFGLTERYNYREGNLRHIQFGRNQYDLVLLGHIIHSEGEKWGAKLIKKSADALREGGLLLIADMIPNDQRSGPVLPLVFGLNMLLHTAEGSVFTMKQYKEWLKAAGFKKIWTVAAPGPSPIILASK
ncbi:MAG: methyltransferase domain-containing protein [Acidobacteria bacterium]|nr:methyltransferase domain-containing protein [Acidobacteriota bacterium]